MPNKEAHVVLGSGAVGRMVATELVKRNKDVRVVNRSGKMEEAPTGAEVVAADLRNPAEIRKVTRGASVVYQCAQPKYNRWPQDFLALQSSILEGLYDSRVKLVLAENLYMYGDTRGKPIQEDMPYTAKTRKGKARAMVSEAAFVAHRTGKVRITAARGSDYFGPWGTNSVMGARAFYPLLLNKPANVVGRADLPHTYTYLGDFARAMIMLGERDEADGRAWHIPNDHPQVTQNEILQMFAEEAGVNLKIKTMGKLTTRIGGLFIPQAGETVEMFYEFEQPFIVDSSRFESTFGMKATPMRQAIRETVAWYRSHLPA